MGSPAWHSSVSRWLARVSKNTRPSDRAVRLEVSVGRSAKEIAASFEPLEGEGLDSLTSEVIEALSDLSLESERACTYTLRARRADGDPLVSFDVTVPAASAAKPAAVDPVLGLLARSLTESHQAVIKIAEAQHSGYAKVLEELSRQISAVHSDLATSRAETREARELAGEAISKLEAQARELASKDRDDSRAHTLARAILDEWDDRKGGGKLAKVLKIAGVKSGEDSKSEAKAEPEKENV